MKIPIFPGKYHQNGWFSTAMLVSGRVLKRCKMKYLDLPDMKNFCLKWLVFWLKFGTNFTHKRKIQVYISKLPGYRTTILFGFGFSHFVCLEIEVFRPLFAVEIIMKRKLPRDFSAVIFRHRIDLKVQFPQVSVPRSVHRQKLRVEAIVRSSKAKTPWNLTYPKMTPYLQPEIHLEKAHHFWWKVSGVYQKKHWFPIWVFPF